MSGGEIKNVVLNASRFAFVRSESGPVTMEDFVKAVGLESDGSWCNKKSSKTIGFVNSVTEGKDAAKFSLRYLREKLLANE